MRTILLFYIIIAFSCKRTVEKHSIYPRHVGDIAFDSILDDPAFKVCDEDRVAQYYNFGDGIQYKGEMPTLKAYFTTGLKDIVVENETGYLTIRFIVNCEAKVGRLRVQGMDNAYQAKKFNDKLEHRLVRLVKNTDGWIAQEYEGKKYDYYQYLTFKIEKGKITDITP
jgi:hypothetical protein